MLTVWRLLTARHAQPKESAFSGEGARLYGGRWNRKGVPMVYTAGSQSLAMLGLLVQDEPLRARYVMIAARLPKNLKIERIAPEQLPIDWRDMAARQQLQAIGTDWANAGRARRSPCPAWSSPPKPTTCSTRCTPRSPRSKSASRRNSSPTCG